MKHNYFEMIQFDEIVYFDCETTGIPPRDAKWDVDYEQFPRICQLAWTFGCCVENHIIRPDGWEIPQEATEVHGITTEYAQEHGEPLEDVLSLFIADCKQAKLICGHNLYFDVSTIKSEIMRRNAYNDDVEQALHKGKRIDTMRPSMKWVDARFPNGRLKFPKLEELYARCFPGETFPAHDAIEDVRAVARCLPVLVEKGIIELAVKEYPEDATAKNATNGPISQDAAKVDTIPTQQEKRPYNENSAKITGNNRLAELMADEDF